MNKLRTANINRDKLWGQGRVDLWWRVNELSGEVGELCNCLKKIEREKRGLPGSRITIEDTLQECADIIICLDLLGMDCKFIPVYNVPGCPKLPDDYNGIGVVLQCTNGLLAKSFVEQEYEKLYDKMCKLYTIVIALMEKLQPGVDVQKTVAAKFNATSNKVGIPIYMEN